MLHFACILLGLGLVAGTGLPKPVPDRAPTQAAGFPAPIVQRAYLKASNTGANDFFGTSVAAAGPRPRRGLIVLRIRRTEIPLG